MSDQLSVGYDGDSVPKHVRLIHVVCAYYYSTTLFEFE